MPPTPRSLTATQVFLRGLAITLPPILTLVILLWITSGINRFVIQPISSAVRFAIAQTVIGHRTRSLEGLVAPDGVLPELPLAARSYRILPHQRIEALETLAKAEPADRERVKSEVARRLAEFAFVPLKKVAVPYGDYYEVADRMGLVQTQSLTANGLYMELATTRYFQSLFHLSAVAVVISIVSVYSIGRVFTHRLGAWFVVRAGAFVSGVPLIGEIYSAVKRVTDFFFAERDPKYHRVVAIEYPRPGIWSLAFVTGGGMPECAQLAGEPLVNVLVPSTPLPFAGYTMSVKKSEVVELNMTLDQAFQYVMSCGVVVPPPIEITPPTLSSGLGEPPTLPGQAAQPAF